ncbi:FAD-binding protein [Salinibacterium sp. NSLL150]|uniref:FAD-binding protein n=1 Tax=unclassified Salinibacterium TaxID=2632331 RepID=UPI0018CD5304|nr:MULTISPECIES: FAD-binding protein [unclassified Salinibacterium]MBH0097784.1 FAD-binding protein [Salinibacterium sp. NSLL35]MBH0100539.1 FAD-binding protein [Salinibacterium sp. NSLL150]MBH0103298.1 FAD-binding protein [Salinibacterium sp. NSLL16]MBH0106059.1 FAD-binding protein [Salinibacterium sp. NSLL17]
MSSTTTNWAGNLTYSAETVLHPTSATEVQQLVAQWPHVRALGTRHSFTDIADTPGALISLAELDPAIRIDPATMTVSVAGGTSFGILINELEKHGFALHNTGSLPHISVAGATATGTHGSGDGNGILSTAIAAVELVTADGSLVTVDRTSEHLPALAVGLGAFGIITRVTLDIEPSYRVRQDVYRFAPWETVLEQLDDVMASAYSVSLLADFASPTVMQIWLKTRLADGMEPEVASTLFGGVWYDDSDELSPENVNQRASVPGPWSERMPHFRLDGQPSNGGDELQSEYYVAREHGVEALEVLRTLGTQISPHLLISEIRTAAADSLWMSPAYERDVLCIGFTWAKHPAEVAALLPVIEQALAPFAPRQHWGKLFHYGADVIHERFPRSGDFLALQREYDPQGKFWNPFLERTLGPR